MVWTVTEYVLRDSVKCQISLVFYNIEKAARDAVSAARKLSDSFDNLGIIDWEVDD